MQFDISDVSTSEHNKLIQCKSLYDVNICDWQLNFKQFENRVWKLCSLLNDEGKHLAVALHYFRGQAPCKFKFKLRLLV